MKLFLTCLFCFIGTYIHAFNLSGTYDLVGSTSRYGSVDYRGYVIISPQGDNYRLDWQIGSQTQVGVGILSDNILSVAYRNDTGTWGVVSYFLTPGGDLEGKWTSSSSRSYGLENLTWRNSFY